MMRAPPNSNSLFYNYKGYFSIGLMALVDADYRFIFIDVGNYGSNGDSGIFKNRALGEAFAAKMLDVPPPKLMRPYPVQKELPVARKLKQCRAN